MIKNKSYIMNLAGGDASPDKTATKITVKEIKGNSTKHWASNNACSHVIEIKP